MRATAAVVALALGAAGPALAQRAERPDVRAGDRWDFVVYRTDPSITSKRTWIVDRVTPARIEGRDNGEPLVLTADLNVVESPRERSSSSVLLRFPLDVGAHWSFASDYLYKPTGSTGRVVTDVIVAGHERIAVPAGEFDAFRLEAKAQMRGKSPKGSLIDAESFTTYWYAPAARSVVKWVQRHPYLGPSTVEMASFALQP